MCVCVNLYVSCLALSVVTNYGIVVLQGWVLFLWLGLPWTRQLQENIKRDISMFYYFIHDLTLFFTFGPSAGCPECICNRQRPWSRPCVSDWGCGAVTLLSRCEFGREKNNICYQRGGGGGGGGSEPFAICQIYNIILLFYSTFSFWAKIGVKDRTLYFI